jgi:hypothetical protein
LLTRGRSLSSFLPLALSLSPSPSVSLLILFSPSLFLPSLLTSSVSLSFYTQFLFFSFSRPHPRLHFPTFPFSHSISARFIFSQMFSNRADDRLMFSNA